MSATKRRTVLAPALLGATFVLAGWNAFAFAAPARRPGAISFTSAQATAGRFAYYRSCAECHGGDLAGNFAPALAGPSARTQFETPKYVYGYYSVHMPHGNPGSLPQAQYVDIMAFLLTQHGRSPGAAPLTAAAIDADTSVLGP